MFLVAEYPSNLKMLTLTPPHPTIVDQIFSGYWGNSKYRSHEQTRAAVSAPFLLFYIKRQTQQ